MKNLIRIWLVVFFLSVPNFSWAKVYTVNTEADITFPPQDVVSLRSAITMANQHSGTDLINIPAGHYILSNTGTDEDANLAGDLDVVDNVFIVGQGPDKTIIDGGDVTRVLHILSPGVTVVMANLTIQNGTVTNGHQQPYGAGILNNGTLALVNVTIKNNANLADNNIGGGIYNHGILTVTDATFSGNQSLRGGALFSNNPAQTTIKRSLFVNNRAFYDGSAIQSYGTLQVENSTFDSNASIYGSAIHLVDGTADLSFCTITNNSSEDASAALDVVFAATLTLRHTILAANRSTSSNRHNCSYIIPSAAYNLEDADTCSFSPVDNLINTDPKLGPLQDNGGPTQTRALAAGSPAIDRVRIDTGITVDQRGKKRPHGIWADIGAYEYDNRICFPIRALNGNIVMICM